MIVNANSIVQHVIQIKNGTKINVNVSTKSMVCAEKITIGIAGYVFRVVIENMKLRIENSMCLTSIVDNSAIVCDENILHLQKRLQLELQHMFLE